MSFNRLQQLLAVAFLVFATGTLVGVTQLNTLIHDKVKEGVHHALESSLNEKILSSQIGDKHHDEDAVLSVLNGINEQLKSILMQDGYNSNMLPVGLEVAQISRFDDINSAKKSISISGTLKESSTRFVAGNEVTVETYTSINWGWVIAWLSLVLFISAVVYKVVPQPLIGLQRTFYNFLAERVPTTADEIIDFCSRVVRQNITLSKDAWWLVGVLLPGDEDVPEEMSIKQISDAYDCATENSQIRLDDVQRAWIRFVVTEGYSCNQAVDLALSDESVEVDLQAKRLLIKGFHEVDLTRGPLAYYCFYLNRRIKGLEDGWVTNTPANLEYQAFNDEVIKWLEAVDAPLNTTQEIGSTQLNNMRNRIVRQISASFNDESNILSEAYGFESRSSGHGAIRDFRVLMMPEHISTINWPQQ